MVKKVKDNKKLYFQCKECRFNYKDKNWAEKCEQHCRKYHSCNFEIVKHSIDS
ncbi:MAG: hypothetical protein AABX33_05110 [Nanoarchaeota archaeon]